MGEIGAYGQRLGDRFRLENVSAFVTRTLPQAELAVTEIRGDNPLPGLSDPIPCEDACLVALQLRDYPGHHYWEDGKQAPVVSLRAGETVLYDLKRNPVVLLDKPFHSVHFHLPRGALDAVADEAGTPRVTDIAYQPGGGVADATMRQLGMTIQAALERPHFASRSLSIMSSWRSRRMSRMFMVGYDPRGPCRAATPLGRRSGPRSASMPT